MCIGAFVWQTNPHYPLILFLNRDEYHNRPTKEAGWWECGEILGGRDEVGGGTWMACSRKGRMAFVTNVLELNSFSKARTRGDLPIRFLESSKSPKEFADEVAKESDQYNGFNLIIADLSCNLMLYVSNRPKEEPPTIEEVSPGVHVLSNGRLDSPWPKAEWLGLNLITLLEEKEMELNKMVHKLMRDTVKADKSKLPHIWSLDWELNLSSVFVQFETPLGLFGTRSTIALTVGFDGEVCFNEEYLENKKWKEKTFKYNINEANITHKQSI
ncbi:transport and Golgi organization 2 homolog [Impatiens glandulifera]|uniref:transport and Golgi organization 2 homolog n=1 Tax=Impatiens glandulifera TaxID=253017 RepID=UPI001FB0AC9C|nr:transport and Golgi organization 2 homolog [Impatiens glandulifera]